jgi:hypothetical protein
MRYESRYSVQADEIDYYPPAPAYYTTGKKEVKK